MAIPLPPNFLVDLSGVSHYSVDIRTYLVGQTLPAFPVITGDPTMRRTISQLAQHIPLCRAGSRLPSSIMAIAFLILPTLAHAQKEEAPKPAVKRTIADLQYSEHKSCTLDFWKAAGDTPRPLHIHIHGGGWTGGDKTIGWSAAKFWLDHGVSHASINYRLTGETPLPAPVHDAAYAIQFIRSKAKEWNIDPDRIVLTGGSAGACTSMWMLFHDDLADPTSDDPVKHHSTRVTAAAVNAGQVSIDPPQCQEWLGDGVLLHRMIWTSVGAKNMAEAWAKYEQYKPLYQEFTPYNHLTKGDPPLLMTYGTDMSLPSKTAGHGIHHPVYGVKMKEKADKLGVECHLLIPKHSKSDKYADANAFLLDKLGVE
ncbi:alpha/beta hydrolase [Planctomycetaceae bacterium]|nr:alpha/beta hydrolase [Planctomycetaceae bacterium]MDC0307732.1 alpha/beta hydrolase [Planctomycetaceae bacterium]